MAKTNTKRMTSHVWRTTMHSWTLAAAIAAIAANVTSLLEGYDEVLSFGMFGIGFGVFAVIMLVGFIASFIRSGRMKKKIQTMEQTAAMAFDADTLEPLNAEKNLCLGKEWLMINAGHTAQIFPKGQIASADSITPRKEGMKKVWARIHDKNGKSYACMYRVCEPDALGKIKEWLGVSKPEPERSTPEPVPEGTCPFCTGPNEPGSKVCQWCGSALDQIPAKAGFQEPAKTAPVIQPGAAPLSIPDEPKKNGKGVWIIIGLLVIVLAVLLYMYYL